MIIAIMLLTASAYLAYRFMRFCHRFSMVDENASLIFRELLRWMVLLFQVLTCVGLSWIALSFVDLIRNNP